MIASDLFSVEKVYRAPLPALSEAELERLSACLGKPEEWQRERFLVWIPAKENP